MNRSRNMLRHSLMLVLALLSVKSVVGQQREVRNWISKADQSQLMQEQAALSFTDQADGRQFPIIIDERQVFQEVDGFGFALTGGSAEMLHAMEANQRAVILKELFGAGKDDVSINYIRLSIGASDLNRFVYTYNDLPDGATDVKLKKFNLGHDYDHVLPVLKEILAINPHIKIMASPWTAPTWMKTSSTFQNGSLKPEYYSVYANYLLKYVQEMNKEGVSINTISVQNEPLNSRNTPSMPITIPEMRVFIREHLGPLFHQYAADTKIILFDHNCDRPDYSLALLSDPKLAQYVDGSGFHHYGGDISTMSLVHQARPDKNIYFTEQMVIQNASTAPMNFAYQASRLLVGTMRHWSRNMILWNLAADPNNDPHTDNGGCGICQGAITIDGNTVTKNIAYYVVAHASKFVPAGSYRICSNGPFDHVINMTIDEENPEITRAMYIQHGDVLPNVAFKTPDNKIVVVVANDSFYSRELKVQYKGMFLRAQIEAGSIGTFTWDM